MQKDFHHGTIYALARIAGFTPNEAAKAAYASQYVDDSVVKGVVEFDNGNLFKRGFTSHKATNPMNLDIGDNLDVWLPFHFLPGNEKDAQDANDTTCRLLTRPGSSIAEEMIDNAILQKSKPYGLHLFGIALHVYADTWSHQGFAGIRCDANNMKDIKIESPGGPSMFALQMKALASANSPILTGHAQVWVLPDLPYLKEWSYVCKENGERCTRRNFDEFTEAVQRIFKKMQKYLGKAIISDLDSYNLGKIRHLFETIDTEDGDERHRKWCKAIKNGTFQIGGNPLAEDVCYDETEWKRKAIGSPDSSGDYEYSSTLVTNVDHHKYIKGFLNSDWKNFHDAAMAHRFFVTHELLPKHGICAG